VAKILFEQDKSAIEAKKLRRAHKFLELDLAATLKSWICLSSDCLWFGKNPFKIQLKKAAETQGLFEPTAPTARSTPTGAAAIQLSIKSKNIS
jgi:hypothetical protein